MTRATIPVLLFILMAAAPLRGQVVTPADSAAAPPVDTLAVPAPPDTAAEEPVQAVEEAVEDAADAAPPAAEAEVQAAHDWEFALTAAEAAPGAGGSVQVTEGEGEGDNAFAVVVRGLPAIDSLDEEGRDVAEYGVWIVPSKERVSEATRVGTLTIGADGAGRFEGTTALDTFGVIVIAQAAGATGLSGVAVLTGIPVTQAPPAEEPAVEEPPAQEPAAEEPAPEVEAEEPADETPDDVAPETPDDAAPETPDEPPAEEPAPPPPGQAR